MAKVKIETVSTLCCKIHPQIKCACCGLVMCSDCGKKWSERKHFILDMCRTRFTYTEIREAANCFKKRIGKDGTLPKSLGDCSICVMRSESYDFISDRQQVPESERHL